MNVLEAFDGPFAAWRGDADWRPWRTFFKSLTATRLDPDENGLFQRCTGRTREFAAPPSEAWLVVGRRGRKSAVAAMVGVHAAVHVDWSPCLAPGETARVLIVAVDKNQARIVRAYAEAILQSQPEYEALIDGSDQETIRLRTGVAIQCVANSFRSIRGPAVACAIFEELAFWYDERYANPDKEVWRAVRPSMLTTKRRGALLIGISSPYAKRGLLYEKYRAHHGKDASAVLVWQADTLTMNPEADAEEIEEAYRDDPAAAAAEYGAAFRSDVESFVSREAVEACVAPGRRELPPLPGVTYSAFVDPSGGGADSFTLAIGHEERGVRVLDALRERRPPFSPDRVVEEFAALLKTYRVATVTGDRYAGEWPRDAFRKLGISYVPSEKTRSELYQALLPLVNSGRAELLDHAPLVAQLANLERRTSRGGRDSIDHPPHGHDDLANAAAGVLATDARVMPGFFIAGGEREEPWPT